MRREAITAPKLYAMLDREFRHVRNPACTNCRMPLPFFRAPADEFTANWHIGTPKRCDRGCHLKIAEILARLWTRYDLKLPVERRRKQREVPTYDVPVVRRHFARTDRTYVQRRGT
ncbi:MAG TPA: hypothetical protein VM051_09645 [Usitatibacter sp.]|nr:hypothetical protein [Usitatibacter sp.]